MEALISAFERRFGRAPAGIAEAPGRVNLIGEHVDYNEGFVLPCALDRSALVAWAPRDDDGVRAYAVDYEDHARFLLSDITPAERGNWSNYVRGVASVLREHLPGGIDLALSANVPAGAGLSSSAAVQVAVAGALRDAYDLAITDEALALLCQRAENEFVGVQSGIMDQFASALCRRDHALLIDCRTLEHRDVPLRLATSGLSLVVVNSGVRRELVASAYNRRREECEEAVALLRVVLRSADLMSLRNVTPLQINGRAVEDSTPLRRARHVVSEIARVAEAVAALAADDFAALGTLMDASHESLRLDYEASSPELDLLVELASQQDYVAGARLTGAGFGGCTVNLVRTEALARFEREVVAAYATRTGLPAEMYVTAPSDGLRAWRL